MSAHRRGALVLLWRGWRVIVPVMVANAVIQAALVGVEATLDRGGLLLAAALTSAAAFAAAYGLVASAALEAPGGWVRWRAAWHRLRRHGLRYATWALGLLLALSLAMMLNDLAALLLVGATAVLPIAALDDRGSPPAALLRAIRRRPWRWLALTLLTAAILAAGIVVSGFTVFFLRGALASFVVWLIGGLVVAWLTVVWARIHRDAWDVAEGSDSAAEVTATPGDAVGGEEPRMVSIVLADHDPAWAAQFQQVAARIIAALGDTAVTVEHAGSTSVPGLAAKPIIDVVLVVPDSADEDAYVPALEGAGFAFGLREPDWYEHRLLRGTDPAVNLHVFSVGCPEVDAMIAFRDHLRTHPEDRDRYERTKRDLASREWGSVQDYADAKTEIVRSIQARIDDR